MSLESWEQEFYPVDADSPEATRDDVTAVKHCIQKWRGLLPANLSYHDMEQLTTGAIEDRSSNHTFRVDADSCALCQMYSENSERIFDPESSCGGCPLYEARGQVPCCDDRDDEETNPYENYIEFADPNPMLDWLHKALKYAEESQR